MESEIEENKPPATPMDSIKSIDTLEQATDNNTVTPMDSNKSTETCSLEQAEGTDGNSVIPMDSNKSIETLELARATDSNIESNKSKDEDCDSSSNVEMKSQSDNESNSTLTHNIEEKIQLNSAPHVISDLDSSSLNSSICPSKGYASNSSTDERKHKDFIPPLSVDLKTPGGGIDKTAATNGENDENTPGPSNVNRNGTNTPNRRPKCKYGKQCYRKNPQHKIEFCHKGDTEYETSSSEESETDKPQCMYGSACFRKNSDHRKKFSHKQSPSVTRKRKKPTKGSKSPNGSPSNRTKKRRKTTTAGGAAGGTADVNMSSEDDSYDYEDPFLANDATEDEYVATSSLSESSSPLSDPEDDSHTNRRLIKEAKRFMR